ncbi:MAG TPA: PilZ domain-containing protein [Pyrinomonadaceae bacterium]|nr:PilZ domain-containing protein [Pyrinomonadaceae bacterium]
MKSRPQSWPPSRYVDRVAPFRRQSPRCEARLKLSVRFGPPLLEVNSVDCDPPPGELRGLTRDLSETGLAVNLTSNHIGDRYFNVVGCTLQITLELPDGPVQIRATPKWCRWLTDEHETRRSYLLGLRIIEMTDEEWVRLVRYVHACL